MRLDALADMRHSNVLQLLAYFAEDYDLYIVVPFQVGRECSAAEVLSTMNTWH